MAKQTPIPPEQLPEEVVADLGDLLQELRILLNGVQVLVGFLIILPFSDGFHRIAGLDRWVYVATFLCALLSLIFFAAPAAQHRLMRPLPNRERFKEFGTRMAILGLIPFSFCLVLSTHLVTHEVVKSPGDTYATVAVGAVIAAAWWIIPMIKRKVQAEERERK